MTQQDVIDELSLAFDRTRLARIEAGEGFQSLDRALSVLRRLGVEVIATIPDVRGDAASDEPASDEPASDDGGRGT
jgi:hypothetical protein